LQPDLPDLVDLVDLVVLSDGQPALEKYYI
jgi:hypothetical protein